MTKRKPTDATLRNVKASNTRYLALNARAKGLEKRLDAVEARLAIVEELIVDSGIKARKR